MIYKITDVPKFVCTKSIFKAIKHPLSALSCLLVQYVK